MKTIFSFLLGSMFFSGIIIVTFCQSTSLKIKENNGMNNNQLENQAGTDVLSWDNGFFASLGIGENFNLIITARFADTLTSQYLGYNLEQIQTFIGDLPTSMIINVFDEGTDSAAGPLLYSQDVSNLLLPNSFNTFDVDPPIQITGNDIWIGYEVAGTSSQVVIGCDFGPVHPDGDWMFDLLNPASGWYHLSDYSFNNNWVMRGYLEPVLPVELISFLGSSTDGNVTLNWSTATETNNMMFEIERRNENSDFVLIGFVEGNGSTTEPQNYSFVDRNVTIGKYYYRLKQIDFDGTFEYSNEIEVDAAPVSFSLEQNYPNPFNPSTTIKFNLPEKEFVTLKVYDVMGKEVDVILDEEKPAGSNSVEYDATGLASGTYFYKLQAGNKSEVRKMLLIK